MAPSLDDIVSGAGQDEEVELDFSGAIEFDPVPADTYPAVIKDCVPGTSKAGEPKLTWTFILSEGKFAGRQLMRHTPTKGKGSGLSKQVMKAIGVDVNNVTTKFRPSTAAGKHVLLEVGIQEGTEFNEIKRVKAAPSADALAAV